MNFALILFILTVATGLFWITDRRRFAPERARRAQAALARFDAENRDALERGDDEYLEELQKRVAVSKLKDTGDLLIDNSMSFGGTK